MRAVWTRARIEFRTSWRSWLALALVVGAGAGAAIALVAAAHRTDRTYARFSRRQNAADVIVAGSQAFGFIGAVDLTRVAQQPSVLDSTDVVAALLFTGKTSGGQSVGPGDVFPVAPKANAVGRTIERWKMLSGRPADPARLNEATASFELARRLHLKVGSTVRIHFFLKKSFAKVAGTLLNEFPQRLESGSRTSSFAGLADGPEVTFKVVGIEASPAEFPPLLLDLSPILHLTTAFYDRYGNDIVGTPAMYVRLRHPSAIEPFKAAVERQAQGQPVSFISTRSFQAPKVQRSFRVESTALAMIGLLLAITFFVIASQALTRQALVEAADHGTLRAVGMTPNQLRAVTLIRCTAIGVLAAGIAVGVALAMSPFMLLGLARKAELDHGVHFDPLVVGLGAVITFVLVVATAVFAGWLAARRAQPRYGNAANRRSLVASIASRAGLPPASAVGVRFALRRERGAKGVPIWTTIVGATLTVALLVGTWSFTGSLRRLIDTPHLYGWNWDLRIGAPALPDIGGTLVPALQKDKAISGLAAGTVTQVLMRGQRIDLLSLQKVKGKVAPTYIAGRAPESTHEIALGARTMRKLHLALGDEVRPTIGDATAPFRVVGRAVFPEFGDAGQLGTGGYVTLGGLDRILSASPSNRNFTGAPRNVFFIKFGDHTNLAAERQRVSDALEPLPHRVEGHPADLADLERVSALPELFSGILTVLAVILLVHTLITSVRRRRRELAVLEAIGFVRRQVRTSVVVHSVTLIAIGLLIGIPLGVVAGRTVWKGFAYGLGVASGPVVPLRLVGIAIAAALAIAAIAALAPAWLATRSGPAFPLRTAAD